MDANPFHPAALHAMNKDEMHKILSEHLAKYREWSYTQLAERVERDRQGQIAWITSRASPPTAHSITWSFKPFGMTSRMAMCEFSAPSQHCP